MTRDVKVKIIGSQRGFEEEEEVVKKEISGCYYYRNDKHYVLFEDNDLIDFLRASGEEVYIKNKSRDSKMIFNINEETRTSYYTDYGSLDMEISTKGLKIHEKEDIIAIKLCYTLSSNGNRISENIVDIIIEAE